MRHTIKSGSLKAALFGAAMVTCVHSAQANQVNVALFQNATGINTDTSGITETWDTLKQMGTDEFLGGVIGGFKLDESSLIAGALSLGVTEFDNFLRTGTISSALGGGVMESLTSAMSSGAGFNLSSLTGSFTQGGGQLASAVGTGTLGNVTGGATTSNSCDPEVASSLVANANKYINEMTNAAMSDDYGFSQMEKTSGGGQSSGFAGLGCLDMLFQNAGSDILFKPPSLSSLTSMLQTWSCDKAEGVAQQVAGAFGGGLDTSGAGGYFPAITRGEAFDGVDTALGLNTGSMSFLSGGGGSADVPTVASLFN